MRISTPEFFNIPTQSILDQQTHLARMVAELSSGKKVNNVGDNPSAAAKVLGYTHDMAHLHVDRNAATTATNHLKQTNSALSSVSGLILKVRQVALQASNATTNASERRDLANTVKSALSEMVQLANSQTPGGTFLFAGSQSATQPFSINTAGKVSFHGDAGANQVNISKQIKVPISVSGQPIFMDAKNGNGFAVAAAATGNTGSATVSIGGVENHAAATAMDNNQTAYKVSFTSGASGGVNYQVTNTATGSGVASGAYSPDMSMTLSGNQVTLHGKPAIGDSFTIKPAQRQSLFQTLKNLQNSLEKSGTGGATNARFSQAMSNTISALNQASNNVLGVQATLGSRLDEVKAVKGFNATQSTQDKSSVSRIADANVAQLAQKLNASQVGLNAGMKAFAALKGSNLFNTLRF